MIPTRPITIGILGDGQLGRMLAQAAQRRGFTVRGFGQDPRSPLAQVVADFVVGAYNDTAALHTFVDGCDFTTCEFENVPAAAIKFVGSKSHFCPGSPRFPLFETAQDRLLEKEAAQKAGLTTAPFYSVDSIEELEGAVSLINGHGILKTRRFGYDGKGQWRIAPGTDLQSLWADTPKSDLILEGMVPFAFETSVIIAQNNSNKIASLPCGENRHENGVLAMSLVPGRVTPEIECAAQMAGERFLQRFGITGLIAIEFFVLENGDLVFNEFAPRPHNSGHWSIEGADISQFDLAIDALLNLELRTPAQLAPTTMVNVLGEHIHDITSGPHTHWHDYGKQDPKPGRKMGHYTILDL